MPSSSSILFNYSVLSSFGFSSSFPFPQLHPELNTTTAHSYIMASSILNGAMEFPESGSAFLEPHLPPQDGSTPSPDMPYTPLNFATSLDSSLALSPGAPTALSGPQSQAMTHYQRSRHDGILIGVGTAVEDNPSLNCRIVGVRVMAARVWRASHDRLTFTRQLVGLFRQQQAVSALQKGMRKGALGRDHTQGSAS
jgi:hypothetical protein